MSAIIESTQPPLSNKGGNTPDKYRLPDASMVAINLDWLRYTVQYNTTLSEADNLRIAIPRFPQFQLTGEEQHNGRGFNRAQKLSIGVIHWHTQKPDQGVSVELSGGDLRDSRSSQIADMDLLQHVKSVLGKVSTMDSAIDVYNYSADPDDIIRYRDRDELKTTVRSIGKYDSSQKHAGHWKHAKTVYVGSPTSERQIKVYNKAAQLGINGDWVRIEMRWRGPYARAAHSAMLKYGIHETTRSAILAMVDFKARWWKVAMSGPLADIEPIGRKDTRTLEWLMGAVLNTLDRELSAERMRNERELFNAFDDVLSKYRPKIDVRREM